MYYKHFLAFAYLITVHSIVNNKAVNFANGHSKRELNFNNYPATTAIAHPREYNFFQRNEINDPGYTAQHDDKQSVSEKNSNSTSPQNSVEAMNPTGQMFHFIYMLPSLHKRELASVSQGDGVPYINAHAQNLAYAGPHLFPAQLPHMADNNQQFNIPIRNFNAALQNIYSNQQFLKPFHQNYIRDSKVTAKMEAPFVPSQFLGYGQHQGELLPQQQQHQQQQQLLQQSQYPEHQQMLQQHQQNEQHQQLHIQNQLLPQQQQPTQKPAPVYEQPENSPYQYPRLIYAAPNNIVYHGIKNSR